MSIEYLIIVDPLLRYVHGGKYLFGILSVVGFSLFPKALSELTMRVLDLARKVWNFDCRGHNPGPSPNRPDDPTWSMGWIHPYQA